MIKSELRQDTWEAPGDTFMSFLELKARCEGWKVASPVPGAGERLEERGGSQQPPCPGPRQKVLH